MAYNNWRLAFSNTPGGFSAISITEWLLKDSAGNVIPTAGGSPSASSFVSGDPASNAFDGNMSTFWASDTNPVGQWLAIGLPSAADVDIITVTNRPTFSSQIACDIALQYNNGSWVTKYIWRGICWVIDLSSGARTLTFTPDNAYPPSVGVSYRLQMWQNAGFSDGTVAISEWQLFDTGGNRIPTPRYASITDSIPAGEGSGGYGAFDNDTDTYWASAAVQGNHWIRYDFQDPTVELGSICLISRRVWAQSPPNVQIEKSTDGGSTWTVLGTYTVAWTAGGQKSCIGVQQLVMCYLIT